MEKLYYASACSSCHGDWLDTLGYNPTTDIEKSDVIIFGGGADICPETYGEETSTRTYTSPMREKQEISDFHVAKGLGKKMIGICRGHQLLSSLAGGKLIQDVSGHSGDHDIKTVDGLVLRTNSIHHQMVNPFGMNPEHYRILAWSHKRISKRYIGAKDKEIFLPENFVEVESIYLPTVNALGWQYHPN
jgi:putative glutamine amidotransferase